MNATNTAPTGCDSCGWLTCPGCDPVPVYDNGERCESCGSAELTQGDGYLFCCDCETRVDCCTCAVEGDEDVQCARCKQSAADEYAMEVM
jgi:hypothetical protein